jgi:tRNA pseudouridine38-40 synthase
MVAGSQVDKNPPLDDEPSDLTFNLQRVALIIQYLGGNFYGWQRQANKPSVQQTIEDILGQLCNHKVIVHGAGRTDTGVHAAAQVAHFDTHSPIPACKWAKVLNSNLPSDILVCESAPVSQQWHARFSATWRRYRYMIFNHPLPNLFIQHQSWHYYLSILNQDLMQQALAPMVGEHDFTALQRTGSKRANGWTTIKEAKCWRDRDCVYVEVRASGFLYGMIRLLMGLLIEVGRLRLSVTEFTDIWQQRRRSDVRYAAPPHGLCLLDIGYNDNPFVTAPNFSNFPSH